MCVVWYDWNRRYTLGQMIANAIIILGQHSFTTLTGIPHAECLWTRTTDVCRPIDERTREFLTGRVG